VYSIGKKSIVCWVMFNGVTGIVANSCISGRGFAVNFCCKAVIGSMKEQIQKVDGDICLWCGFEL
jgi:hypothetical protein